MKNVDPALVSALREQLAHRPAEARRVGWKVGRGDRERIGRDIVVGHLTTATLLEPGAVAFDEVRPTLPSPLEGRLVVNDVDRANARVDEDFAATVLRVARILGVVGERLQRGDRIITGSVVQVGVSPGDTVVAEFGALGRVGVSIA